MDEVTIERRAREKLIKEIDDQWQRFYRHESWKGADDQELMRQFDLYIQGLTKQPRRVEWLGCTPENPCCDRRNEYNGFGSGPLLFECPKHCPCHD